MIEQKIKAIRELLDKAADGEHEIGNVVCALAQLVDLVEILCNGDDPDPQVDNCVDWCAQCNARFEYSHGNAPEKCPRCGHTDWQLPF